MNIVNVNKPNENLRVFSIEVKLMGKYTCKLKMYAEDKDSARMLFEDFRRCNNLTGDFRKIKLEH